MVKSRTYDRSVRAPAFTKTKQSSSRPAAPNLGRRGAGREARGPLHSVLRFLAGDRVERGRGRGKGGARLFQPAARSGAGPPFPSLSVVVQVEVVVLLVELLHRNQVHAVAQQA